MHFACNFRRAIWHASFKLIQRLISRMATPAADELTQVAWLSPKSFTFVYVLNSSTIEQCAADKPSHAHWKWQLDCIDTLRKRARPHIFLRTGQQLLETNFRTFSSVFFFLFCFSCFVAERQSAFIDFLRNATLSARHSFHWIWILLSNKICNK